MGALGSLLSLLFGRFFFFVTEYITARLLIAAALVAMFIGLLGALTILFNFLIISLYHSFPPQLSWGLGFIPPDIPLCLSSLITARTALWVLSVKIKIMNFKSK